VIYLGASTFRRVGGDKVQTRLQMIYLKSKALLAKLNLKLAAADSHRLLIPGTHSCKKLKKIVNSSVFIKKQDQLSISWFFITSGKRCEMVLLIKITINKSIGLLFANSITVWMTINKLFLTSLFELICQL